MKQVFDGKIGKIVAIETTYNSQGVWDPRKTREQCSSDMEYQMRNWYYYCWLSGDHIVEQAVHGIDTMAWVMGDKLPLRCWGVGGRQSRTDPKYGNIWDHFSIVYEYPDERPRLPPLPPLGQHAQPGEGLHPRHQGHGRRLRQRDHRREQVAIPDRGPSGQAARAQTCTRSSTTRCSPRSAPASRSTTASRPPTARCWRSWAAMAAYTGEVITPDQVLNSKLDLSPASYEFGPNPVPPVPVPGTTKFI